MTARGLCGPGAPEPMTQSASWAVALAFGLTGCVLPVAPQFEDPEPNVPPFIFSATPPEGQVVTVGANDEPEFDALVADPNLGDQLSYRWIIDYPPYDPSVSRLAAAGTLPPAVGNNEVRGSVTLKPNCFGTNIARGLTSHRLLLLVSDRPFLGFNAGNPFEAVPSDAYVARAVWTLNLDCP